MPGRKDPPLSENERDRRYRTFQKRSYGDHVTGELAEDISDKGAVEEVREERRKWREAHPDGEPDGRPPVRGEKS